MKLEKFLTTDYLFHWLSSQKYEYIEWFNSGLEVISLADLYKQSAIFTNAIINYLQIHTKYELEDYSYKFDQDFQRITRTSPKIKRPTETKLGYTIRKIKEVAL